MQHLGINTIRVYNVDGNLDHDECASIFNAAGIYMILDVNSGLSGEYIDRSDPSSTYTLEYLKHVFGVVEAFAYYPNTLGFFAANEILNQNSSYDAPLYIRAVVRDLKDYIAANAPRDIAVGYSAADVDTMLTDTWNYLGCELKNSTTSKIDFFGLNDYEWCGASSFTESGYNKLVAMFADTAIPVFFSEYGCNNVEPRTFSEVPVLYSDRMKVMSGGLVYEFTQEPDDYGLVVINSSTEVTLLEDFEFLKEQFGTLNIPDLTALNNTAEALTATSCAASLISETSFYNAWGLPSRPSGADALVSSGLDKPNTGSTVSVTATAMPATVYNYTGAKITGLSLVQLGCKDSNQPGLVDHYTPSKETCTYATGKASSGKKKNVAPAANIDIRAVIITGSLLASFVVGILAL